jgi:KAP family P-loop domain
MTPHAPFLVDEPDSLGKDAFGHIDYADALHSIVTDEKPPLTVGLFGPWGVGKSSIIGALQARLVGDAQTAFAYFDAWRYEGDSLRRQFLLDIATDLEKDGQLEKFDVKKKLRDVEYETQKVEESVGWSKPRIIRLLVIAAIFGLIALALILLGIVDSLSSGSFGKKVLIALVTAVVAGLAAAISQSISIDAVSLTRRRLEDPDRFAAKFVEVLEALRPRRLVIAIDNLDRTSPEKAVEILSTIKTYLEPTVSPEALPRSNSRPTVDKEIVFVIAVDDEALRRHLAAREQARSDAYGGAAAALYVEEYLAKFFGARLPIRGLLDDDMRDYVTGYMKPLADARGLDADAERDLITVVNAGLRGNPRGVKQFHNDLEVRLRLLEERETAKEPRSPGIAPPVSGEVAMVAKLALIEREWPEAFHRLQADPQILERWMIEARRDDSVDWTSMPGPTSETVDLGSVEGAVPALPADRRRLATFLRASARIESKRIRALLSLKQAPIEIELPTFSEFRDALIADERERVSEILAAASEQERTKLAARVITILAEELSRGHLDAARSVVDVICSSEAFVADEDVAREVIEKAADEPDLQRELPNLDPVAVLRTGELLDLSIRRRLFAPFLDTFHRTDLSGEERAVMARALAPYVEQFSQTQRATLQTTISGGLRDEYGLYLPFVEADPSLLATVALESALRSLAAERGEGDRPDLVRPLRDRSPAAIEVVKIGMRSAPTEAFESRLLVTLNSVFNVVAPSPEDLESDLPLIRELLGVVPEPRPEESSVLARSILEQWGAVQEPRQREMVEFMGEVLARCSEAVAEELAPPIGDRLFEGPANALRVVDELDPIPDAFRKPFLDRLDPLKSAPEFWSEALGQLKRIDPDGFVGRLIGAFDQLFRADHFDAVDVLLDRYEDILLKVGEPFTATTEAVLSERLGQGNPGTPEIIARLFVIFDDEARDRLGRRFAEVLAGGQPGPALNVLVELPAAAEPLRLLAAHYALPRIDSEQESPPPAVVDLVCRCIGRLPSDDQGYFAEQMAFRIRTYTGRAVELAEALMNTERLPAGPSAEIAAALLEMERSLGEQEGKSVLLAAAWHLRVQRNTKVWKWIEERAAELEREDGEIERELARRLREWIAEG